MSLEACICTVGHSNREIDGLIDVLEAFGTRCLVDVRSHPGSRRHPHFNRENLKVSLAGAGIDYLWQGEALGGLRKQRARVCRHEALEPQWAAYATHMETAAFKKALDELIELSGRTRLAIMCAEKDPAICHRQFISDYLTHCGQKIVHLLEVGTVREHRMNPSIRVEDDRLVYDRMTQGSLL